MNPDINFFYTLAKISATLVGLIFVTMVSFYFPHVLRVRDDLKGFSPFLKIRFPDYLIITTTSNLTILLLAVVISFNFMLNDAFLGLILDIFFTSYIFACLYFTSRFTKRFFFGSCIHEIKKQIGTFKCYRVILLPLLIFLISLMIIFVLNIPEIRIKMDFRVISSILILFGLICILLDIYMFQAEKLFFHLDQTSFRIIENSIKKAYDNLENKINSLTDNKQKEMFKKIFQPIKELVESFSTIEKSNIVIAGSLIDTRDAYFALEKLKEGRSGLFEGQGTHNERSTHF